MANVATDNIKQTNASKTLLAKAKSLGLVLTSGYRSPSKNASIGGSKTSDHVNGTAYDFAGSRTKMLALAEWAHKSGTYKQVIFNNKDYATGKTIAGHQDHVHIAWGASGSKVPNDGVVEKGDTGSIVKAIQKLLGINDDGMFGPNTENAVEKFQEHNKLVIDGLVGVKTWDKLTGGGFIFFS